MAFPGILVAIEELIFVSLLSSGSYFIDRNGRPFGVLLDLLRTGVLFVPADVPLEAVLLEANFYLVDISAGLNGLIPEVGAICSRKRVVVFFLSWFVLRCRFGVFS